MEDDTGLASLEACFLNLDHPAEGQPVDFLYFDRKLVDFGKRISIAFQVGSDPQTVFQGLITAIGGEFPEAREPELIVHAEDALARARMRRRTRVFEKTTDAKMLQQVAGDVGLNPSVQLDGPTYAQHLEVNQSELDLLRERVDALDGLMTLSDRSLSIGQRSASADPPVRLTNYNELIRFTVMADLAHQRTEVRVHGWDVAGKQAIHETADSDDARAAAGGSGPIGPDILGGIWSDAAEDLHLEMPSTSDEARALAKGAMHRRARAFVRGRGIANGNPALKVGARVELVDIGALFSGVYQLTSVRHCFDASYGYRTHFEASRADLGEAQ
jgi:phage protein D